MVKITKFKEANINVIITIHTEISIIKVSLEMYFCVQRYN